MCPRTKGFTLSLPMMNKIGGIYDATIVFKAEDKLRTIFRTVLNGEKITCYIYLQRIPFDLIPKDSEKAAKFLHDLFIRKVRRLIFFSNEIPCILYFRINS